LLSTGLQVRVFGRVAVLREGCSVPVLSAKALELLCYLLLHRGRAHTRDALSRLLWPDAPESQARKYLRQTLWQLQTTLTCGSVPDTPPLLDVQAGQVRVNPAASVWCDVDVVEQTTRRCADVAPAALTEANATACTCCTSVSSSGSPTTASRAGPPPGASRTATASCSSTRPGRSPTAS
jgi:DNA-binding SARP family transcriptional activator